MASKPKPIKRVILAYSGGLDTSVIIPWLKDQYHCEVIAYCANIGQAEELSLLEERAIQTGASKLLIEDLRLEFVVDYIFPMLRANAAYEGEYLLGTSIARPLIAKRQLELAEREGADAVAHGATGKGNDQIRFELTYLSLKPNIHIIAPWREWSFESRKDLMQYAQEKKIPITVTPEKPYSTDRNLFHISFEGGILEDPWLEPPKEMFLLTTDPQEAPDTPETITLEFEEGNPVGVNGQTMAPVELMETLNQMGGNHGIGRVDLVENRYIGMKSRGVYETPGGTILHKAHQGLESITLDREVLHLRDSLTPRYSLLVYNGYWFSPEREILQQTMDHIQKTVTGTVRLKLFKGSCTIVGRKSPRTLYRPGLASFDQNLGFKASDAEGFIRLNALRLITQWEEKNPERLKKESPE